MWDDSRVSEVRGQWMNSALWGPCPAAVAIPLVHLRDCSSEGGGGGLHDHSLTRLHFQDTKMHQAAQAEHMEVQKRGNHGTLSAQLHNEKSNPLVVSIRHVMFCMPVAEPGAPSGPRSDQLSLPTCSDLSLGWSVSRRETETKQLINMRVGKKEWEETGTSCVTTKSRKKYLIQVKITAN